MSAGRLLVDRQGEIVAAIEGGRVPAWAKAVVRELIERECRSIAVLDEANAERSAEVHAGIHRAADRFLPALITRGAQPRSWAGALWSYLERRYALFGLERRPCRRVVGEAIKKWAPPSGGTCESGYCGADNGRQHGGNREQAAEAG
jgi:hypothetical protein